MLNLIASSMATPGGGGVGQCACRRNFTNSIDNYATSAVLCRIWHSLVATHTEMYHFSAQLLGDGFLKNFLPLM